MPLLLQQTVRVAGNHIGTCAWKVGSPALLAFNQALGDWAGALLCISKPASQACNPRATTSWSSSNAADGRRMYHSMFQNRRRISERFPIPNVMQLNTAILKASDWHDIRELVNKRKSEFNLVNVAAALYSLAHMAEARRRANPPPPGPHGGVLGSPLSPPPRHGAGSGGFCGGAELEELVRELVSLAQRNARNFDPSKLSSVAWSCAKLGYHSDSLLPMLEGASLIKMPHMRPQHFGMLLWSFAYLEYYPAALLHVVPDETAGRLREFSLPALTDCLWAFASLRHHPGDDYVQAAMAAATALMAEPRQCVPAHITNTLWSLGVLGADRASPLLPPLLAASLVQAQAVLPHFNEHYLCAMLQALAALDALEPEPVRQLCRVLAPLSSRMTPQQRCVYRQVALLCPPDAFAGCLLPPTQHAATEAAWREHLAKRAEAVGRSSFTRQVTAALRRLGIPHRVAQLTHGGSLLADILLETPAAGADGAAVLLLYGPHVTARNSPHRLLGTTLLSRAAFLQRGVRVGGVTAHEWRAMGELEPSGALQLAYLARALAEVGVRIGGEAVSGKAGVDIRGVLSSQQDERPEH